MSSDHSRPSRFPETRWSLVTRAAAPDEATRQKALAELLVAYMPGLRDFLVETRRIPTDLADDLLHGFVADKVLSAGLVSHADQGRGKFRNFVLKSLNNYVSTKLRKKMAARVVTSELDSGIADDLQSDGLTERFEREWARQVVRDALQLMEADALAKGRSDMWEMFRLRVVDPMLQDAEPVDYDQIVHRLGIATPRQAINLLANAKRCFNKHLRTAVAQYVADESQIDQEIDDLRRIVGR